MEKNTGFQAVANYYNCMRQAKGDNMAAHMLVFYYWHKIGINNALNNTIYKLKFPLICLA